MINDINQSGYGLTFGIHSRIKSKVDQIKRKIKVGNVYINRNQIGAIVGSQPFGGEGLSGTGPKAGGPLYTKRFLAKDYILADNFSIKNSLNQLNIEESLQLLKSKNPLTSDSRRELCKKYKRRDLLTKEIHLPGPTGEDNTLTFKARGIVVCLGPTKGLVYHQAITALSQGNYVLAISQDAIKATSDLVNANLPIIAINEQPSPCLIEQLNGVQGFASNANNETLKAYREILAIKSGPILPLITEYDLENDS